MKIKDYQEHFWVEFDNAVRVEIYTAEKNCGGIGRVKCGRTDVRCEELPVLPLVTTVDGYQVQKVDIQNVEEHGDDCVVVTMRPYLATCGHVDPENGHLPEWNVGEWNQEPERDRGGELEMVIKEVNRELGGLDFRGFSYAYKFRSRKYHPKFVHYRGTWELAASATRNEVIAPSKEGMPHKRIQNKKDEFCSSEHGEDPLQDQFKNLFTEMQGFTYQYDNHNVLLTTFEQPVDCQTIIQKESDENYMVQWHQHHDGKSENGGAMEAPAHQILCADTEVDTATERANEYNAIKLDLQDAIQEESGIPRQYVVLPGFLSRELWHRQDEIERGIEKLEDAGCQEIILPDITHQADIKHHHDEGMGSEDLKNLVQTAVTAIHKRDIDAGMQVDAPELMQDLGEDAETSPADKVEEWVNEVLDEFELDSLYLVDKEKVDEEDVGGGPAGGIPFSVEEAFHQAVTKAGLRSGSSGFGPLGPVLRTIPFEGVRDNEWLFTNTMMQFPYVDVIEGQGNPKDAYFRGLANRLCYGIAFESDDGERPVLPDWLDHEILTFNTAFGAVSEYMVHPEQLSDGRGVLWRESDMEDAVRVLWANTEFEIEGDEDAHIYDVMRAKQVSLGEDMRFTTEEKKVYMLEGNVSCS